MVINDFTFGKYSLVPVGANLWELENDVIVRVNMPIGKDYRFTIKKGFVTNLRSGTDLINPIIPRMGDNALTICYILHDANYTWIGKKVEFHFLQKDEADNLLLAMLKFCGMGYLKRKAISIALSLFGGSAYKEKINRLTIKIMINLAWRFCEHSQRRKRKY